MRSERYNRIQRDRDEGGTMGARDRTHAGADHACLSEEGSRVVVPTRDGGAETIIHPLLHTAYPIMAIIQLSNYQLSGGSGVVIAA